MQVINDKGLTILVDDMSVGSVACVYGLKDRVYWKCAYSVIVKDDNDKYHITLDSERIYLQ